MTSFAEIRPRAPEVRGRGAELERRTYGREGIGDELGLVGGVADLAKPVQAEDGVRAIDGADALLAHELADCFPSVSLLADRHGVDLARAFLDTMTDLEARLR